MASDQARQTALCDRDEGSLTIRNRRVWENWKDPATSERERTFVILTTPANDLLARIHDRMPAILKPSDYERWLGIEPDPHDLLGPFASALLSIWPISKRVNSPDNDDERLLDKVPLRAETAA
jgi:putative SOS response-associated peptidase YedK